MKTLRIGIAGYDQMKARTLAIARGERGKLVPRVPYDQVRLDVSLTGRGGGSVGVGP